MYQKKCTIKIKELDGVGSLITDPPPASFTSWSKKKKKKGHMTCDMWHKTRDT